MDKESGNIDHIVDDLLNDRGELSNFVNDHLLLTDQVKEQQKETERWIKGRDIEASIASKAQNKVLKLEQENARLREAMAKAKEQLLIGGVGKAADVAIKILGKSLKERT